jgi:serine/threonine protein kinase
VIQRKDKQLLDLLEKIFVIDPAKRITIDQIMEHPFVKIFKGRVEEKKSMNHIRILYEERKLSPEDYRTLLLSEL